VESRASCSFAWDTALAPLRRYAQPVPAKWIKDLGIQDAASAGEAARAARDRILDPARRVLETSDEFTVRLVIFQGFVARAQCLHEAAVQMTDAENPHAAFTLLRAYAENAAAILYAKDHPTRVDHFADPDNRSITVGHIKSWADKRWGGFKGIYDQLSQYAHPHGLGLLASSSVSGDRRVTWASAPHFKAPGDQLVAYAWAVELAESTHHLLYEFAQTYQLGYFGQPSPSTTE